MPAEAIWTTEQREAITFAADHGLTFPEAVAIAAAGELEHEGEPLAPFEMTAAQARGVASRIRAKRPAGERSERIVA